MSARPDQRKEPSFEDPPPRLLANRFAPPRSDVGQKPSRDPRALPQYKAARMIRFSSVLIGMSALAVGAAVLLPMMYSGTKWLPILLATLLTVGSLVAGLWLVAGAVARRQAWGRNVGIVYGLVSLFGFPLGTIVGLHLLWHLVVRWSAGETEP